MTTILILTNLVTLALLWRKNEAWCDLMNKNAQRDLDEGRSGTFYV